MTSHDLIAAFDAVAEAPDGIARLRELVLRLAVRGRLVPQDPGDEPASMLLERIAVEKVRMVRDGEIREPTRRSPTSMSNVPFDVPKGWEWVPLGQYCHVEMGQSPPSADYNTRGKGLPFFQGKADFGATYPTSRYWCTRPTKLARPGDVLLSVRAPVGPTNIAHVECCIGRGLAALRPLASAPTRFLLWMVRAFSADLEALGTGTTFAAISRGNIDPFLVPVPPLAEQHRIVARIDELMGLLDQLEAARRSRDDTRAAVRDSALDALREADTPDEVDVAWTRFAERMDDLLCDPADIAPLRQTVLELAVRGKLVPQDPTEEPASALLERIAAEKARLVRAGKAPHPSDLPPQSAGRGDLSLPQGWRLSSLSDVIIGTDAGWSPKCDPNPTTATTKWGVLKTTAIQPNRYLEQHHKTLPGSLTPRPELEVAEGDVLVTRAGPWFRVGVAACVASTRPKLLLSDKIIRCRLVPHGVDGAWVALCINTGPGARYLLEQQSGMDKAQMNISQPRLRSAPIPVPPLAEQRRIVARVDELMGLLDRLGERIGAARTVHLAFAAAAVHHLDA